MSDIVAQIEKELLDLKTTPVREDVGRVLEVGDGVARLTGLGEVGASEVIKFPNGISGVALNLETYTVGAIILGDYTKIKEGDKVTATGRSLTVPVGEEFLGRVINPLGEVLDGKKNPVAKAHYPIERPAPTIMARKSVSVPLQTGIKAIDSMIPIGRGQRELIIGDRNTGKTSLALDTILNQKDVICIYVAIGQKASKTAKIVETLRKTDALKHTIVISSTASDPASLQYIAPYAGTALGEYFMDKGQDVLLVYDDLSKHAWAYRQMSLLLRRPSGREAYPGDVFYLHSRLLERSGCLDKKHGGGTLTALPIIETQASDVSSYIPTNVISITDGQIYLEPDLFYAGVRPAISVGLSVSRVGGTAQTKAMKKVAGRLRLDLAQFRELAAFAQFSSDLDRATLDRLERGKRIVEALKQPLNQPIPLEEQVVTIWAANQGYLDKVPVDRVNDFTAELIDHLKARQPGILKEIAKEKDLNEELLTKLIKVVEKFTEGFLRIING
ncbi:MAG: F0F1 ATP synthase subunit alpha [bacterium]|nr:F0F1 ATP synthase subunit alpha [bacterium]